MKVIFFNAYLGYIKVFKNTNILCNRTFVQYKWSVGKGLNTCFFFTLYNIDNWYWHGIQQHFSGNPALKALKWYERMYYLQILLPTEPKTLSITLRAYNRSLVISYIDCFRLVRGIRQPFLIQRAIVTNLNFTVSPTRSLYTFFQYSKLFHDPISL